MKKRRQPPSHPDQVEMDNFSTLDIVKGATLVVVSARIDTPASDPMTWGEFKQKIEAEVAVLDARRLDKPFRALRS